jgi:competence protein ComFC
MSGFAVALNGLANAGLNFLYPESCQICRNERATPAEGYVGPHCWTQIRFIRPPFCERCGLPFQGDITTKFECTNCREMELHFTAARSAVIARGVVLEVIHRYKYQQALWFEPFLADLLAREAGPELRRAKWDFIVPVPLHTLKYRERGFNQAERLADCLSSAVKIPVNKSLLRRVLPTSTQTQLTRPERAANVRRAFAVRDGLKLSGERIVLVDDVFTTGATTSACARALMKAGAGEVCVWTVARGL